MMEWPLLEHLGRVALAWLAYAGVCQTVKLCVGLSALVLCAEAYTGGYASVPHIVLHSKVVCVLGASFDYVQ
jgi:hypothetical protein